MTSSSTPAPSLSAANDWLAYREPGPAGSNRGWFDQWFDRVPRLTVEVGERSLPAFRSFGIIGFQLALVISILAALRVGLPLTVTLGLSSTAGFSFFAWALLRRTVTGRESLVLLEHVWVATAAVAGYLLAAKAPILAGLDVFATGLPAFLGMGRIGCFTVGCCHGTPTASGIRYGPAHDHLPPWLVGRRLRPVQLIEAGPLFAISAIGFTLLGSAAGTATVWFLASYAVLRFGTESLRGDQRPRLGSVTVARLMALVQLGFAVWLAGRVTTGRWAGDLVLAGDGNVPATVARIAPLILAVVAAAAIQRGRRPDPLTDHDHLRRCWQAIEEASANAARQPGGVPILTGTDRGLSIGVSALAPPAFHLSFRHPDHDPAGLARVLGAGPITTGNGIVHGVIDLPSVARPDRIVIGEPSGSGGPVDDGDPPPISLPYPSPPADDYFVTPGGG